MRSIIMLVTVAGRRLTGDGVPFIGSRYTRRLLVLSATLAAVMVVGVLGYATPSRADVACDPARPAFCMEKTATPDPVKVGEPLTFTIRGFCAPGFSCGHTGLAPLTDTLPAGLEFVSASATGVLGEATCSESAGTVTCAPFTYDAAFPFEATIEVIPMQCGTFTNTATDVGLGSSVSETFTVEGCVPLPTTKAQCKKGGWRDFGYPDQGTCISDVNQRNR
jgi:hypothetical protein